jgi:hypothetical protein
MARIHVANELNRAVRRSRLIMRVITTAGHRETVTPSRQLALAGRSAC